MSAAAMAAPPVAPTVAPSVPVEATRQVAAVRAAALRVASALTGAPSAAMQERARRELGQMMAMADALRQALPAPAGLRTGTPVMRVMHAIRAHLAEGGGHPHVVDVAALVEASPNEAWTWLRRAQMRGWVQVQSGYDVHIDTSRWALTDDGATILASA